MQAIQALMWLSQIQTLNQAELRTLVIQLKKDFPEYVSAIRQKLTMPAEDLRNSLIEQFPELSLLRLHPQALVFIERLQHALKESHVDNDRYNPFSS